MNIATWNVNSVRARLEKLTGWLEQHRPDIVCLQETKVQDDKFPRGPLEDLGYNVEAFGQKTYNGVAILSREPLEAVVRGFPEDTEDSEKRLLGAATGEWVVLNLYVPNGSSVGTAKYAYKLEWLARLAGFLRESYDPSEKLIVTGDFNITFDDRDVHDPARWHEKILCSTREREALRTVMEFPLHDALRKHREEGSIYTWWDHRAGAFRRDHGLRIDHFLVSDAALECCADVVVDREARKVPAPSDHAPVIATFES